MAVRTRRLFGPTTVAPSTTQTLYTCPADRTARILTLWIVSIGAGTGNNVLRINSTTANPTYVWSSNGVTHAHALAFVLVLEPTDTLVLVTAPNVTVTISAHGSLLQGAPS